MMDYYQFEETIDGKFRVYRFDKFICISDNMSLEMPNKFYNEKCKDITKEVYKQILSDKEFYKLWKSEI